MASVLCPVVVGRHSELTVLGAALKDGLAGNGSLIFVTGEAGIGKSRLARELADLARSEGALVATGRGVPNGATTPYRPLTEALQQCLRQRAVPDEPALVPWLPALGAVVPTLSGQRGGDSSSAVRGEAVNQLLRRLADPVGLLIVVEDLHWADPDTLAVVEYLGDNLAGARVLCVATSRDEAPPAVLDVIRRLVAGRRVQELALERLDAATTEVMVRACVPGAAEEVIARVKRTTDGVPFLIEEVLASPGVPVSFRETVGARLDDLSEDQRLVLSVAGILGRHFDWTLLPPATGRPADVVTDALEHGVQRQLLRVDGGVFAFRHALTREVIVERLLPPRRRELAAGVLTAVMAACPGLDGPWRDLAADLALQAGEEQRAAAWLIESGRVAIDRGALATAVDVLGRAGRLGHPEAGAVLVEALALAGRVDEALALAGRVEEAVEVADAVLARRTPPGDDVAVHLRLAHAAVAASRWSLATQHLAVAEQLLADGAHPATAAWAAVLRAELALATGAPAEARQLAADALGTQAAGPEIRCQALEILGRVERPVDLRAARALFEQALGIAREHHLAFWQVRAMHELGTTDMFDHVGTERLTQSFRASS